MQWTSPTKLTREEAKQQAADLLNCRLGVIKRAENTDIDYAYEVTLASGQLVTIRSPTSMGEQEAIEEGNELVNCREMISQYNASFKINRVEQVSTGDNHTAEFDQLGVDFSQSEVVFGWIVAVVFFFYKTLPWMNTKATPSIKVAFVFLVLVAAFSYGVAGYTILPRLDIGLGPAGIYSSHPSIFFNDIAESIGAMLPGFIAHYAANRIRKRNEGAYTEEE